MCVFIKLNQEFLMELAFKTFSALLGLYEYLNHVSGFKSA